MEPQTASRYGIEIAHEDAIQRLKTTARSNMLGFTKYTMPEFRINWHHRVVCHYLDKFLQYQILNLMFFMQPQVGKTELISRRLPAMIYGQDPRHQIVAASYAAEYSQLINRDVQRIIDSEKYYELFPSTQLAGPGSMAQGNWVRNNSLFEIVEHGGRYHAVGCEGGPTGKTANTLIIDDPVKNWEDASSMKFRDKQWDWLISTAFSRMRPTRDGRPPRKVITLTSWNHDGVERRLLRMAKKGDWTVVSLPAIKENNDNPDDPRQIGEALWPEVFPISELEKLRELKPRIFNALYMQRPTPDVGQIVQRGWWKYYKEIPANFDTMIQSWDLTFTETRDGSYVVGQVWGKVGANKYLIAQMRARAGFNEQITMIMQLTKDYPLAAAKYIEKAANGHATASYLQNKISGIILVPATKSKEDRARAVSPQIQSGNVWLPDPSIAPWIQDFVDEWAVFPDPGSPNDQVDCSTQALAKLEDPAIMDFMPVSLTSASRWGKI